MTLPTWGTFPMEFSLIHQSREILEGHSQALGGVRSQGGVRHPWHELVCRPLIRVELDLQESQVIDRPVGLDPTTEAQKMGRDQGDRAE